MSEQTEKIRAVIYAALSKRDDDDGDESIASQVAEVRQRLGDRVEVGAFSDHGYSGSKRNRGPGLEGAINAVVEAAERHGEAELWAVTSARFGRGSGLMAGARALGGLFYELRAKGVALRTVHDDEFVTNEMLIGFASRQASKYAEDLSAAVKRSKRRQAEAGQPLGGPPPDGWTDVVVGQDEKGEPVRERVLDPERASLIRHLFGLADQGMPDAALARHLNAEGHRTRSGRPWDRRAVQNHVTNAWHAGRVVHHRGEPDEEVYDGKHEPLVDPATFERIQERREKRDLGAGQHVKGRPAHRHLLAKLARCGACGAPMFAMTSSYRRKDGSRARQYVCRGYHQADGTCDLAVDAGAVDTAVMENLPRLMPRFDEWVEQIEDRHAAERQRLAVDCEKAREEHQRLTKRLVTNQRSFLELDPEDQQTALASIRIAEDDVARAAVRVQATEDALASIPEDVSHDRLLDFASALRAVIAGKVGGDHSVRELNLALTEVFSAFTICAELPEGTLSEEVEDALRPGSLYVFPNVRPEVFIRLLDEYEGDATEAPPMEWIEALAKSADTQE